MSIEWKNRLRALFAAGAAFAALLALSGPAQAQQKYVVEGEPYVPTIWIDPDGCEHWVMDDGVEGYMSPHTDKQGRPVCHKVETCAVMNTDTLFATDSSRVSAAGRARLEDFFRNAGAITYRISGHTDSRGSDEYNMALSKRRAMAAAKIARAVGANVSSITWYGERQPVAPNTTPANMQKNRRVEIMCVR